MVRIVLAYRSAGGHLTPFMDTARLLDSSKGTESHDDTFGSAVFEDYSLVSSEWRDRHLAAGLYHFCALNDPDSSVLKRMGRR